MGLLHIFVRSEPIQAGKEVVFFDLTYFCQQIKFDRNQKMMVFNTVACKNEFEEGKCTSLT